MRMPACSFPPRPRRTVSSALRAIVASPSNSSFAGARNCSAAAAASTCECAPASIASFALFASGVLPFCCVLPSSATVRRAAMSVGDIPICWMTSLPSLPSSDFSFDSSEPPPIGRNAFARSSTAHTRGIPVLVRRSAQTLSLTSPLYADQMPPILFARAPKNRPSSSAISWALPWITCVSTPPATVVSRSACSRPTVAELTGPVSPTSAPLPPITPVVA